MATKREKVKRIRKKKYVDASVTRRALSYFIDWYLGALATAFPIAIISQKLYGTMLKQDILNFKQPYGLIGGVLALICAFIYYVVIPLGKHRGQTLGKRICKIKIVQQDGTDVTAKCIILRQLLGVIMIEGVLVTASAIWHQIAMILTGIDFITPLKYVGLVIAGISCLLVLFKSDHLALHDYLAKTKVVMSE